MSDKTNLNSPEHCLEAMAVCIRAFRENCYDPQVQIKDSLDALRYHAGVIAGLQELRDEWDLYRAALERIASQWAQPARDIARQVIAEVDKDKTHD